MTDKHAGYIVTLADDISEDDERTLNAIRMIKGVESVTPVVANVNQAIAMRRRDNEWRNTLLTFLHDGPDN